MDELTMLSPLLPPEGGGGGLGSWFGGLSNAILEALSLARDLTIFGRRDNVAVIREQNGVRTTYQVDLRSTDLFNSPAYYLQQNDIIYVTPNKVKAGQSTINENTTKSAAFWVSVGSFLTTVATLIATLAR